MSKIIDIKPPVEEEKKMLFEKNHVMATPGFTLYGTLDIPQKDDTVDIIMSVYTSHDDGKSFQLSGITTGLKGDHTPAVRPSDPTNPWSFALSTDGRPVTIKTIISTTKPMVLDTQVK